MPDCARRHLSALCIPFVRLLDQPPDEQRAFLLDPARLVRWVYVGRLTIASAIFLAAVLVSQDEISDKGKLVVAAMIFAVTVAVTATSILYSEFYRRPLKATFYYLQSVYDLLLVTAVVHVTGGSASPFAALYILVIATSSLLLPVRGGLLLAVLASVMYFADALYGVDSPSTATQVWLQLGVFAVVALGSAGLNEKLREVGAGTEAVLAQTRLQAADILFNIRSGILTVDAAGRLLYANPMADELLGAQFGALVGTPVLDPIRVIAPALAGALERSLRNQVRTTRAEGMIASVGRLFPIGVTTTYTDGDGRNTDRTATAIFSDISDQKRIETLRLRAERLEGVAELSASLAHEIKNPLASIRSACEQLSRSAFTGADEKTLSHLVMRESDRLSRLLSEFLDFARVRVARREVLDLVLLAEGAVRLTLAHPDRSAELRVVVEGEVGAHLVEGDEDLLHRAVFNLLLNAVQASPSSGEVRVTVGSALPDQYGVGATFDDGAIALSVSDSGAGIADDIRGRLFDPFFTTKPGGSGLGLAVVHRALEAHRGLVVLDSSTSGTRFTIVLPRAASTLHLPVATHHSSVSVFS
jgi:two-component system sensor histidine kinase PilS (NtrC family)